MPRGPGAPRVRKYGRWHGRWRGYGRGRRRSLGFVATRAMHAALRVAFATFRGAAAVGDRLLHAKLPNLARTGALANVSAELETLSAKIDAVEKEISDTDVDLRTAKKSNDTGEVGRLSKREEALRREKEQLLEEKKQLRDEKKLLLERALPAPGAPSQHPPIQSVAQRAHGDAVCHLQTMRPRVGGLGKRPVYKTGSTGCPERAYAGQIRRTL